MAQDDETEYEPEFDLEDEDGLESDEALQQYLAEERLALVPLDFLGDLMVLMEAHIANETGLTKEELGPIVDRLEELLGEDGMMDLSLEGIIDWVNTLKDS